MTFATPAEIEEVDLTLDTDRVLNQMKKCYDFSTKTMAIHFLVDMRT